MGFLCWICSSAVWLNLSLLCWLLLVKACVKILHLFRLIPFETLKKQGKMVTFFRSVFLSHVFTLDKVERYVYGHVIHTWVLPSSLMGLRSGLHPSMLTNTQPLPQIFWRFPLVTRLPNQLQKPLVKHREQFPRGWACCLCNSYLPPPGGTLYC